MVSVFGWRQFLLVDFLFCTVILILLSFCVLLEAPILGLLYNKSLLSVSLSVFCAAITQQPLGLDSPFLLLIDVRYQRYNLGICEISY